MSKVGIMYSQVDMDKVDEDHSGQPDAAGRTQRGNDLPDAYLLVSRTGELLRQQWLCVQAGKRHALVQVVLNCVPSL